MTRDDTRPTAIVMGLSPTGLHIARSLHRLGCPVVGIGRPGEVGLSSNVFTQKIVDEGLGDPLTRIADLHSDSKPVLMPSSDEYVEHITKTAPSGFQFQSSYQSGASDLLLTKADFYRKCDEMGMRYPRSVTLGTDKTVDQLTILNLPVLIKPSRMHDHKAMMRGKKGWIINDSAEMERIWPEIADFPGEVIAQEFIPGPESEIRLVCGTMRAGGLVSSIFTARKLRQYPRGIGSASVVQSSDEPDASDMAVRFLQAIEYEGIFGAEMKRHAKTGELYFIEINPRTSLWFSASEAAGCPVVQQSYLDIVAPDTAPRPCEQKHGVRWRYWSKDTISRLGYTFRPQTAFPPPIMDDAGAPTRTVWAVFEAGDARPALVEPFQLVRKLVRRVFGKRGKS